MIYLLKQVAPSFAFLADKQLIYLPTLLSSKENKMVKIVTVSSSKGGAGKTTTTICLADYWASMGNRVGLIDTDPNKSLSRWFQKGRENGFFEGIEFRQELQDKQIIETAKQLAKVCDILLIDVAGIASISLLKAAGIADLVVIPAQPNEDDFLEAANTTAIVKEAMELTGRTIPCRTVVTRGKQNTSVLRHMVNQLKRLNYPVFDTIIHDRTIYPQARFMGNTPVSLEPSGPAALEIESLAEEIVAQLIADHEKKQQQAA
ncbi:MAG TPA: ParA family protein [Candidatus Woesebacteria bacterium]|nr:ParA family protein [Candidatus Woesebacteria bacterium]